MEKKMVIPDIVSRGDCMVRKSAYIKVESNGAVG